MSKQFWGFLVVGLAVVAVVVAMVWNGTEKNHMVLDGKILKVRTMPLEEGRSLVVVDFRVTNPSGIPLAIREVSMKLERFKEDPVDGIQVSRGDVDTMFQAHPNLGPKYNDVLAPPETIAPGKTLDRMAEASFDVPERAIGDRKDILIHIEDVDGAGFDIVEMK